MGGVVIDVMRRPARRAWAAKPFAKRSGAENRHGERCNYLNALGKSLLRAMMCAYKAEIAAFLGD
ncbi:MAG: hypothetical protein ABIY55_06010 [Kofleriaceae bacterium]